MENIEVYTCVLRLLDDFMCCLNYRHEFHDARQGHRGTIDTRHVQTLQDDFIELRLDTSSEKSIQL